MQERGSFPPVILSTQNTKLFLHVGDPKPHVVYRTLALAYCSPEQSLGSVVLHHCIQSQYIQYSLEYRCWHISTSSQCHPLLLTSGQKHTR
jgi:predicted nucleic acid-binding Zn finger protein